MAEASNTFQEENRAWVKAHPYPQASASDEQREQFYREMARASEQWVERWPDDPASWSAHFTALSTLKGTSDQDLEQAGEEVLRVAKQHPSPGVRMFPHEITVAAVWNRRGLRLKQCVELAKNAVTKIAQAEAANPTMARTRSVLFAQGRATALSVEAEAARKLADYATADEAVAALGRNADANGNSTVRYQYLAQAAYTAEAQGHKARRADVLPAAVNNIDTESG